VKVALVHDWLNGMRGGERCLEALCELYPDAPIFTLFYVKGSLSPSIERHRIVPSLLSYFPFVPNLYRYYLPLFPFLIQTFDLRDYDLILSSSHCVAKGVKVPPHAYHLSYIHTPMRYVWDQYDAYFGQGRCSKIQQAAMAMLRRRLQQWDVQSNTRVHGFIANSFNVAERIQRHYGRTACVVYPPLDWQSFQASHSHEGFYLMVTAFAPYKKVDLAIEAANELGFPLKIIGHGQDEKRLKQMAGQSVEFLGWQPDHRVREFYSRCLAVLFPGEEDFGIVPLEAMATGKPVIAYGKGGVLETVIPLNPLQGMMNDVVSDEGTNPGVGLNKNMDNPSEGSVRTGRSPSGPSGVFYYEQSVRGLIEAVQLFKQHLTEFDPDTIRAHVESFDCPYFKQRMQKVIISGYEEFHRLHPSC
jgi:glycosyltransferase involved in cell wall biosynthesis